MENQKSRLSPPPLKGCERGRRGEPKRQKPKAKIPRNSLWDNLALSLVRKAEKTNFVCPDDGPPVCPSALAGFKGAAALLPVGVDIRLDIHFVCPPPIRPILWLSRWTSATARELESAAYFFTEKAGYENTPSLHSLTGIAYPTVRHWGCTPLDTPQNTKTH